MLDVLRIATNIATPLAFLGLVVTLVFFAYSLYWKHVATIIAALPPSERPTRIDQILTRYNIDFTGLTPDQKVVLILDEMDKRHRKSIVCVTTVGLVFTVCFGLTVLADILRLSQTIAQIPATNADGANSSAVATLRQPGKVSDQPSIAITRPANDGLAEFDTQIGQGGRVAVEGSSHFVSQQDVILLTVTASDTVERPQWGGAAIQSGADGDWSSMVQVGNIDFPPKAHQRFTVKAYILPEDRYRRYKDRAQHQGMEWPPNDKILQPSAVCSFTLSK